MPGGSKLALAGLIGGFAALLVIVWHVGIGPVLVAMSAIGWSFVLILALRLILELAMGACWWVLRPAGEVTLRPAGDVTLRRAGDVTLRRAGDVTLRPAGDVTLRRAGDAPLLAFAWARLIRDSASECLPLSQIGGFVLGGRALTVAGIDGVFATASTVVDVTLELVAQLLYVLGGLTLLWQLHPEFPLLRPLLFGLAVMTAGAAGFVLLQSRGTGLIERASARLLRSWSGAQAGTRAVLAELAAIHGSRPRIIAGTLGHFACWTSNGVEACLILALIGSPVPIVTALTIDSLLYGLRSFAFMIPNALGVQEAGYVLLGGLFGLAPHTCIALSLLRRARDLALGVPALVTWQAMEGRRALDGRGAPGPP